METPSKLLRLTVLCPLALLLACGGTSSGSDTGALRDGGLPSAGTASGRDAGAGTGGDARGDGGAWTDGGAATACAPVAPTVCATPAERYAQVRPIFEARCNGCHAGTPGGPWPLTDYWHIADWKNEIRATLLDCSMPPPDAGVHMTAEETQRLLAWLRCDLPL